MQSKRIVLRAMTVAQTLVLTLGRCPQLRLVVEQLKQPAKSIDEWLWTSELWWQILMALENPVITTPTASLTDIEASQLAEALLFLAPEHANVGMMTFTRLVPLVQALPIEKAVDFMWHMTFSGGERSRIARVVAHMKEKQLVQTPMKIVE
jgi:hypothetical protein